VRWRNPALCKRLLYTRLETPGSIPAGRRPLQFNLAWLERWSGEFETAARLADEAFAVMDRVSDPEGWTELLVCKSLSVYSLGNTTLADELITQGFETLHSDIDSKAGIELLAILANFCANSGSFEEAERQLRQAMTFAEHAGLYFEPARLLQVISRVALKKGDIRSALDTARKCIDSARATRNAVILPYAYETCCAAAVSNGQYDYARGIAHLGLKAARLTGDSRVTCQLYHVMGRSYMKERNLGEALLAFQSGLKVAESLNYPLWTRHFHTKLSDLHEELGNYKEALSSLRAYTKIQTKLYTLERARHSYALRSQLEYRLAQQSADQERQIRARAQAQNRQLKEANDALRQLNAKAEFSALHDALTGAGNRRKLARFFQAHSEAGTGCPIAAMLIDLDRFKAVNDHHGHETGDAVLAAAARKMAEFVNDGEMLIRLGGDEFVIVSGERTDANKLSALAETLIEKLNEPVLVDDRETTIGASIGIAVLPDGPDLERTLLATADEALYQAKQSGRNKSRLVDRTAGSLSLS